MAVQSLYSQVTTGVSQRGQRIVIAAVEKAGKTTLAADAPRAMLVPLENGFASIQTPKFPMLTNLDQVWQLLEETAWNCQHGKNQLQTLAFDSASALERLIHDATIWADPKHHPQKNPLNMETAHAGYGKAYQHANNLFERFLRQCDELAYNGGINIVITCHTFAAKVVDPAFGEYDTWDLLLHSPKNQKNYGKRELLTQWADLVGFLHEPMFVTRATDGQVLNRGVSANQGRVLAVERTPGWVAGNRYGVRGVIPIPAPPPNGPGGGWNALAHAIYASCGIDLFNRDTNQERN